MQAFTIQPVEKTHQSQISQFLEQRWGSTLVVSKGVLHDASLLPGFVAVQDGRFAGLTTYHIERDECELVTIDSLIEGAGIGSALVTAVKKVAIAADCRRLWLITTNDNLEALGFYQKRGFRLVAVHRNAIEMSRQLKPQIPLTGWRDIPIRDEVELEISLGALSAHGAGMFQQMR